jgi:hypothetical protein
MNRFTLAILVSAFAFPLAALAEDAAPLAAPAPAADSIKWFPADLDSGAFGIRALVTPYFAVADQDGAFVGLGPGGGVAVYIEGMAPGGAGRHIGGGFEVALMVPESGAYPAWVTEKPLAISVWPYLRFRIPTETAFEPRFALRAGYEMVKYESALGGKYHGFTVAPEVGALIKVTRKFGITVDACYQFGFGYNADSPLGSSTSYGTPKKVENRYGMFHAIVLAFGASYRF